MEMLVLLMLVAVAAAAKTDKTLEDKATGEMLVDAVVDKIQTGCIFPNDRVFLRRIALVESNDGLNSETFRANFYGGIWQVSEANFKQTQASSFSDLHSKIEAQFNIKWLNVAWRDLTKPLYSALAARLYMTTMTSDIPWAAADQATLWKNKYAASSLTTTDFTDTVTKSEKVCNVPDADMTFVLDASGSIGSSNFGDMKNFVSQVVDSFTIGQDAVRVGLVTFSSSSKVEFALDKYSTKANVKSAISSVGYSQGGTYTYMGLDDLRTMTEAKKRVKSAGVPRIGIVMTDGRSNNQSQTNSSAQKVHDAGITTFAVGVTTNTIQAELEVIGSQPTCLHVFNLAAFTDVSHFKNEIARRTCRAPASVTPGESFSGVLITGQFKYFSMGVNNSGLSLQLSVTSGAVSLYYSYSILNPSPALFDDVLAVDSSMGSSNLFVPHTGGVANKLQTVYAALVGTGVGQPNAFTMGTKSGAAGLTSMAALTLLVAALLRLA